MAHSATSSGTIKRHLIVPDDVVKTLGRFNNFSFFVTLIVFMGSSNFSKCFRFPHSAPPASVPRYGQGRNRSDSVLIPAGITFLCGDQLEVISNIVRANQNTSKLTQGRVEEICVIWNPQLQLALIRCSAASCLLRRFVLCLKYGDDSIFSETCYLVTERGRSFKEC